MDFISRKVEAPEAAGKAGEGGKEFSRESQDKFDRLFGEDKPDRPDGSEEKIFQSSFKEREEKFDRMFGDDKFDKPDTAGRKPAASEWKEGGEAHAESAIAVGKPAASKWGEGEDKFDRLFAGDDLHKESDPKAGGAERACDSPEGDPPESDSPEGDSLEDDSSGNDPLEKKELTEEEKQQKIQDFLDRKIDFEEVKEIYAEYYADAVNSNRPWSWGDTIPGGDDLTGGQKKAIREYAREKGMVPTVPTYEKDGKTYADFSEYTAFEFVLDKEDWPKTDREQFDKCNEALKKAIEENPELAKQFTEEQLEQINRGETPSGYTWHHSEKDGVMQLVPYGVHNSTNHHGGRSEGNWADAPRQ